MDNFEKLFLNYGKYAHIGKKNIEDVIRFLQKKGKMKLISIDELPKSTIPYFVYNISNCAIGEYSQNNEYAFMVYKFPKDSNNVLFYNDYLMQHETVEKFIYVLFELNRGIIKSNCAKLQLELRIYQGIDEEDAKNKTILFYQHLADIESLVEMTRDQK